MIVLGFLMIGIPIAFISPTTGELREQPFIPLFYISIGGIIAVIIYLSLIHISEPTRPY